MMKQLFGSAFALAVLGFGTAGCSMFSNETPAEMTSPVEEAYADPSYGPNNVGLDGGPGGAFRSGPSDWSSDATDEGINSVSENGKDWVEADPTGNRLNMPIIYFAYDSDVLVPSEQANLDRIAQYLQANPALGLVIEGHCDQRGTEEYNRALGERRANAIRAYLVDRGVADTRIRTQSFGKDKPAVEGTGEAVWGQNRRGVPIPMRMPRY